MSRQPRVSTAAAAFGDAEVRSALLTHLLTKYGGADTALIEELGLCRGVVRVDLTVVNGLLHGFEIKSDRDSLRRLASQANLYSRVLDRATLVVGPRHLAEALHVVPDWWGVLQIISGSTGPRFRTVRQGRRNPQRDPRSLVELLWLDDALALLAERGAVRGVRGKPRHLVWDRVCEHLSVEEIAAAVRTQLKARSVRQAPALQS